MSSPSQTYRVDPPLGWKSTRIDAVCRPTRTMISPEMLRGRTFFHYSIPAIEETGDGRVEQGEEIDSGKLLLSGGEILVSKLNPRKGRVIVARKHELPIVASSEFIVLEPVRCRADFMRYLLSSEGVRQYLSSAVQSVTRSHQRIEPGVLTKAWVQLPDVSGQQLISNFLDRETARIDELTQNKRRLIALMKERSSAIVEELVTGAAESSQQSTGSEWLQSVPKHWEFIPLRRITDVLTDFTANGSFADLAANVDYLDSGYARLVRLTDLREGLSNPGVYVSEHAYSYLRKSSLSGGEFLIANVGAYAGLVCEMPQYQEPATLGPNMMLAKFKPSRALTRFMVFAANSTYMQSQLRLKATSSAAQPKLNKEDFRSTYVALPPRDEQSRIIDDIETALTSSQAVVEAAQSGVRLLSEYRSALITAAVTGRIDVRTYRKPHEEALAACQ